MNRNKNYDKNKRNNKGSRNRDRNPKPKNNEEEVQDQKEGKGSPIFNNASMYFKDKQLAEMVTNFSFNQFLGADEYNSDYPELKIPNVIVYYLNPSPGWLDGNVSEGINAISLKAYTLLSANNAKTTIYAPQDVSTLILAMGQLIAITEHARRILGCAYLYSVRNRFIPRGLITSLGIDADDLFDKLAQYRIKFNTIINRMNAIPMVSNIEHFKKSYEIFRHVYTDTESPMAQYYVQVPRTTWIVDEAGTQEGTVLRTREVTSNTTTRSFDSLLGILDDMLNALMTSTTFNAIYSDILRLNKADWTFELCSESYTCMPEYNPMMQLQMMNATIVGEPEINPASRASTLAGENFFGNYTTSNDVVPDVDNNSLRYQPLFVYSSSLVDKAKLINFPDSTGNPDLDQRCDATRYVAILKKAQLAYEGEIWYNGDQNADNIDNMMVLPDYYITNIRLQSYVGDTLDAWRTDLPKGNIIKWRPSDEVNSGAYSIYRLTMLSAFKYAPIMYIDITTDSGQEYNPHVRAPFGEIDYFTFVDYNYLQPVNDLAMQGLFELTI